VLDFAVYYSIFAIVAGIACAILAIVFKVKEEGRKKMEDTTWNYRIVKRTYPSAEGEPEVTYAMHEAYYEDDRVISITKEPIELLSESLDGLGRELSGMQRAFTLPILDYDKIPEGPIISPNHNPKFSNSED
jgi:hypothetical protein